MSSFSIKGKIVIGTIGANILANKILTIDFPNQRLIFSNSFDSNNYDLYQIEISYGRPTIRIKHKNKSYDFIFDTGSSMFEMWTTKKIWKNLKDSNNEVFENQIWSWGKPSTSNTISLEKPISIFHNQDIKANTISYNSNKKYEMTFKGAGVNGIIGNVPFLNKIILIDVSSKQIGIKKST